MMPIFLSAPVRLDSTTLLFGFAVNLSTTSPISCWDNFHCNWGHFCSFLGWIAPVYVYVCLCVHVCMRLCVHAHAYVCACVITHVCILHFSTLFSYCLTTFQAAFHTLKHKPLPKSNQKSATITSSHQRWLASYCRNSLATVVPRLSIPRLSSP